MRSQKSQLSQYHNVQVADRRSGPKLAKIPMGCGIPGAARAHFFTFFAGDGPLEWVRPIPKAPERSWHASGPSFRPNRRFWTHFGPFLMFLARLENQVWAKLGPEPPTKPPDSGFFFLGPIPELFPANILLHFQEMPKIMSTQLTLRYCWHFQEMLENM